MNSEIDFSLYLQSTPFIDSANSVVSSYALSKINTAQNNKQKAIALYYAVRDEILYDPYHVLLLPEEISAGKTLERGTGYCIEKTLLLAACGRAVGVPSRVGFSIVRNHLSSPRFIEMLRSDKFVFHGYNEFWVDNKWVKCTPAFNKTLCEKFNVLPLEFDGETNSIFHEYAADGQTKYMEYLHEYGQFDDFPFDLFIAELKVHYPHIFEGSNL